MRPRIRRLLFCAGSLLTIAAPLVVSAEVSLGDWRAAGEVEIGGRTTWGDDDEGKFLEYRDPGEGAIGAYRFSLWELDEGRHWRGGGVNLGYDDQRYRLEGGRYGAYSFDLFYRELPHVFSTHARTLYLREGSGAYRLPAGVQTRIAGAADPSAQLATELQAVRPTDLELRWIETGGGAELHVREWMRLYGSYRLQDKRGERTGAIDWGTPGGNFATFAERIDEQIHEARAGGELLLGRATLSLEYLGSFYDNDLRQALVDNPLVDTDAEGAASRGRLATAPSNSAHSVALSGASPLPFGIPARAVASLVYGIRLQDERFLPHTVNGAIASPGLALPQRDLDGRVHTFLGNIAIDADPLPGVDLDLRYRIYHYDNQSDEILFPEHVTNDTSLSTSPHRSVANDYTVQKFGAEVGRNVGKRVRAAVGYSAEHWHRSDDRQVENLWEHGPTAKLDFRVATGTSLLGTYAFRTRDGDGYDPFAYFDESLDATGQAQARSFGELPALRKADQADRDQHRFDLMGRTLVGERLEVSASGGVLWSDYRNTRFGIREEFGWHVGSEAYLQAHERVGITAYYAFEALHTDQDSRWRPRSFAPPLDAVDDPSNDWSSLTRSRFHTTGAKLELGVVPERVDLALGYEFHYGRERTTSSGAPGFVAAAPPTTGGDGGNAPNFPEIEERLQAFTAALALHANEAVTLELQYRFEDYDLDGGFRRQGLGPFLPGSNVNGSGGVTPSTDVFLADSIGDYRANVLRLIARVRF
ncbi:MAG: MtrB/PioB family decaheme-associated outer membrane protein [Myxococcales bacterium]|nr:MtrB/PioB family decaheme-associated outer membrane protein [Myxococcales bacterium]